MSTLLLNDVVSGKNRNLVIDPGKKWKKLSGGKYSRIIMCILCAAFYFASDQFSLDLFDLSLKEVFFCFLLQEENVYDLLWKSG